MATDVKIDHLNLTVRNFAETVAWYQRIFGFELVEEGMEREGPWGILRSGDSMLCIYERPNRIAPDQDRDTAERHHRVYHFGLRVPDRKAWENALECERLPTYYNSPLRYPHSTSWYVTDPSGHMIEVAYWDDDRVTFGG